MIGSVYRFPALISLGLGVVIVAYGAYQMVRPSQSLNTGSVSAVSEPARPSQVIVATRAVGRGKLLTNEDISLVPQPGMLPAGAATSLESVVHHYAIEDIAEGTTVLSAQVAADQAAAGLAVMVPPGYRAIEMRTTDEIAVGNFLQPGDHVDLELVLGEAVLPKASDAQHAAEGNPSESNTVLQDVRVLAVGEVLTNSRTAAAQHETASGRKAEPPHAVTLAMTPDQISRFMLASSLGTIHLSLRNPADSQTVTAGATTLSDIRGATPPGTGATSQGNRPIELIVGNKMHHIFSSNTGGKE